ncbi:MAG TPA: hypothetical protein VK834_06960 [Bradyrhizobium sp.]|jgi:hypothetical protein|nr:hypothetical protein [Bradyrhizobium sp.]
MLLSAVATLNPIGLDVIHAAFYSSEALSQNIWKPIALTSLAIMILIVALEWRIRKFIIHRRAASRRP